GGGFRAQVGGHAGVLAGEVGADLAPRVAAVVGLEQELVGEEELVLVGHGEGHRQRPGLAEVFTGIGHQRRDAVPLAGRGNALVHRAAEDLFGGQRVGGHITALSPHASALPAAAEGGAAAVRPGARRRAAVIVAVLLRAVDPVRRALVGGDGVVLRGRLVVPGRPCLAAVDGGNRSLIAGQHHVVVLDGVDPQLVVIVAAGSAAEGLEVGAAVGGFVDGGVDGVEGVFVLGIHGDGLEVPAAAPDAVVVVHQLPGGAGVVGAVEAAVLGAGIHHGVDAVGVRGRNIHADAAGVGRQPAGQMGPGAAAVGGFVQPAAGAVGGRIHRPRRTPRGPQRGVDHLRVGGIKREVNGSGVVVGEQHLLPGGAAVGRAVDAAVRCRRVH